MPDIEGVEAFRLNFTVESAGEVRRVIEAAKAKLSGTMRRGHHFKDWFCPQTVEIKPGFLKLDDLYVRTLYLQDYANFIEDKLISELYELPCYISGQGKSLFFVHQPH